MEDQEKNTELVKKFLKIKLHLIEFLRVCVYYS